MQSELVKHTCTNYQPGDKPKTRIDKVRYKFWVKNITLIQINNGLFLR